MLKIDQSDCLSGNKLPERKMDGFGTASLAVQRHVRYFYAFTKAPSNVGQYVSGKSFSGSLSLLSSALGPWHSIFVILLTLNAFWRCASTFFRWSKKASAET